MILRLIVSLAVIAATVYYFFYFKSASSPSTKEAHPPATTGTTSDESSSKQSSSNKRSSQKGNKSTKKSSHKTVSKETTTKRSKVPTGDARFVRRFGGHAGNITCMAVSPNGEWMATAGVDGLIRVAQTQKGSSLYVQTKVANDEDGGGMGYFQDYVCALSWNGDNRTLACAIHHSRQVAFYRVRKKKDAATANDAFPYELAELVKRRFKTQSKDMNTIDTCLTDTAHESFNLVLTSSRLMSHANAVAWNGMTGQSVGTLTIPSGSCICLSPDGRFLCGASSGGSSSSAAATKSNSGGVSQVKIYEVLRKKIKGQVEPTFDKLTSKSVMTLVLAKGSSTKIADVAFMGTLLGDEIHCDKAVVGCLDGTIQVWSLNVEYQLKEDPKLLCSSSLAELLGSNNNNEGSNHSIVSVTAGHHNNRLAVVTEADTLHVLTYHPSSMAPSLSLDFSIPNVHYGEDNSGCGNTIQFCPQTSKFVYTKSSNGKDVFCWSVE